MPQKHKNNKIRIKINDKKITNYMFDFTRTIIFVFAIISVAFTFIIAVERVKHRISHNIGYLY